MAEEEDTEQDIKDFKEVDSKGGMKMRIWQMVTEMLKERASTVIFTHITQFLAVSHIVSTIVKF